MGLDILSDMALNPKLNKTDIEKERNVILEEIKMYMDLPNYYVHDLLSKLMWPNHSLGMPLAGTFETVKEITQNRLSTFKEKFYSPRNIVITCCGRLDTKDFMDKVEKHFRKIKKKPLQLSKKVIEKQNKLRTHFLHRDTEQTHLAMGFHGLSMFHPDRYAMDLLHVILGGNMSSRLFHEVREKRGLAYDISSSSKHYSDTGAFVINAGLNNKALTGAVDIIIRELNKIRKKKVGSGEFKRAKDFCRGQLLMALENTLSHMTWIGEKVITNDPIYNVELVLEKLDRVTADDVTKVAKRIFKKTNLSIALIGPTKKTLTGKVNKKFYEGFN